MYHYTCQLNKHTRLGYRLPLGPALALPLSRILL